MSDLYGFKNKETGLFKQTYRTIRYKSKTCCFRKIHNAEKALSEQPRKDEYEVAVMAIGEDNA